MGLKQLLFGTQNVLVSFGFKNNYLDQPEKMKFKESFSVDDTRGFAILAKQLIPSLELFSQNIPITEAVGG